MKRQGRVIDVLIATGFVSTILPAQPPKVTMEWVANSDAASALAIQNHGSSPLIAYLLWATNEHGRGVVYEDAGVGSFKPISPGRFAYAPVDGQHPPEITLKASLWADGSTYGDPVSVQRLSDRRSSYRKILSSLNEMLQGALSAGTEPDGLTAQLKAARETGICAAMDSDDLGICHGQYDAVVHRISHPPVTSRGKSMPYRQILEFSMYAISQDLAREMQFK